MAQFLTMFESTFFELVSEKELELVGVGRLLLLRIALDDRPNVLDRIGVGTT